MLSHTCNFYHFPKVKERRNALGILRIFGQEINVVRHAVIYIYNMFSMLYSTKSTEAKPVKADVIADNIAF